MIMYKIECVDKEGNSNNFKYLLSKDKNFDNKMEWKFSVIPEDGIYTDFFYLTAEEVDDKTIKITMMNHHDQDIYIAKGIPEKIIQELATLSEKNVVSSTNNNLYKNLESEFRTPPATKVWERLKNYGNATYDIQKDIYSYQI